MAQERKNSDQGLIWSLRGDGGGGEGICPVRKILPLLQTHNECDFYFLSRYL